MPMDSERKYPAVAKEYKLYEEVGEGVSATVYRALCIPANEIVAIKVLDLERCNSDLDGIRREVQTMNLIDHANVLRAYCSFIAGYNLWVVMPYMAGGSCLHIMKSSYPDGFGETVIATLLRETLRALVYLHSQGHIHRDIKAGNILVDTNGSVKLADFGVSACMFDTGDRQRSRNTFVGTPCWMAPEVMQQLHGYDFKADIWSFGITALELAHGHAPFSKYPPMKVLLMTLQNAPPGLDYERDRRFSKSFKEMVAACLVKDPSKRPTAEKLLKHHFFKQARSQDFIARSILDGLPPLGERFKIMKAKEADLLMQNKDQGEKEQLSQKEYISGISAWNFNLEDLKHQAALIQDDDIMPRVDLDKAINQEAQKEKYEDKAILDEGLPNEIVTDLHAFDNSLASFPSKPLQALKGCFDVIEEELGGVGHGVKGSEQTEAEQVATKLSVSKEPETEKLESEVMGQNNSSRNPLNTEPKKILSGPLLTDHVSFSKKGSSEDSRELSSLKHQSERSYSGPLLNRQKRENENITSVEDNPDGAVVKLKGRFKVTSADLSPKGPPLNHSIPHSSAPKISNSQILTSIQSILQQNTIQREEISKLMKHLEQPSVKHMEHGDLNTIEMSQGPSQSKEQQLEGLVLSHEQSIRNLTEELQKLKSKNAELERQLAAKKQAEP